MRPSAFSDGSLPAFHGQILVLELKAQVGTEHVLAVDLIEAQPVVLVTGADEEMLREFKSSAKTKVGRDGCFPVGGGMSAAHITPPGIPPAN